MSKVEFQATKYANEINECTDMLVSLYRKNGYGQQADDLVLRLNETTMSEKIKVVFVGPYTAGKSTIVSALTGNKTIKIDSDIATDKVTSYDWSGIKLTDTPGLYTENPQHSQLAIQAIRESDLLVYCITSDLFNQYTKEDFIKWAFEENCVHKLFLVINKMSKEYGDYETLVQNYTSSLNKALSPHSVDEFSHCFVDAKDYKDGFADDDRELIELSHFELFISQLNDFVSQKGHLGKLDKPIGILKDSISDIISSVSKNEQDRTFFDLLTRIEKKVHQKHKQVEIDLSNVIRRGLTPIINKGTELSPRVGEKDIDFTEEDLQEMISSCCEKINKDLQELTQTCIDELNEDITSILSSETASYFFNSVNGKSREKNIFGFHSKESKLSRAQFDSINSIVSEITGQVIGLSGADKAAHFFMKAGEASGSQLHTAVKFVGGKLGHSFKPWEAVKIAKNIGNVAKVLGPLTSVIGFAFNVKDVVDEQTRINQIQKKQIEFRLSFKNIASDIENEYNEQLIEFFAVFNNIAQSIEEKRNNIQRQIQNDDLMTQEMSRIKHRLMDIQTSIFK